MVESVKLRYEYATGQGMAYPDISIPTGGQTMILGTSGSGKTTLLHLLAGLLRPTQGKVLINGTDLSQLSSKALDRFRGQYIGLVFQRPHLIASLTVRENILLSSYLAHGTGSDQAVENLLDELGLGGLAARKTYQLSQGQAQRVCIARAVINRPAVLLCDEPTASLDDQNCEAVITNLKGLATTTGSTLIIATHDARVRALLHHQIVL